MLCQPTRRFMVQQDAGDDTPDRTKQKSTGPNSLQHLNSKTQKPPYIVCYLPRCLHWRRMKESLLLGEVTASRCFSSLGTASVLGRHCGSPAVPLRPQIS